MSEGGRGKRGVGSWWVGKTWAFHSLCLLIPMSALKGNRAQNKTKWSSKLNQWVYHFFLCCFTLKNHSFFHHANPIIPPALGLAQLHPSHKSIRWHGGGLIPVFHIFLWDHQIQAHHLLTSCEQHWTPLIHPWTFTTSNRTETLHTTPSTNGNHKRHKRRKYVFAYNRRTCSIQ